jgi:broad specificity phosphatase PhoE
MRLLAVAICLTGVILAQSHNQPGGIGTDAHSTAAEVTKPKPPATILIMRHAEKLTDGQSDLSSEGLERARLLLNLFSPAGRRPDLPTPQVLFAAHVSAHSNRSVQTLSPLAAALHLPIDDHFRDRDYADLAAALLSGTYAGKTVLVAWHRGMIPRLASALGATPPYDRWPTQQFDRIWRIDYINGRVSLRDLPIAMMPGDSK